MIIESEWSSHSRTPLRVGYNDEQNVRCHDYGAELTVEVVNTWVANFLFLAIFREINSHYSDFSGVFGEKSRRVCY